MDIDHELHLSFSTGDSASLSGRRAPAAPTREEEAVLAVPRDRKRSRSPFRSTEKTVLETLRSGFTVVHHIASNVVDALGCSIWYATHWDKASKASAMRDSPKGACGVNTTGGPTFNTTESFPSGLTDLTQPRPAITVGLRHNAPVQQRCTATEFTQALGNVVLPENALSRHVNYSVPSLNESQTLPPFEFSWKLPSCDQPRIYTREEACDIMASFRDDIGGAIFTDKEDVREQCRGSLPSLTSKLFRDRRPDWHTTRCRSAYYKNIDLMKVCPGRKVSAKYHDHNDGFNLNDFKKWRKNLPAPSLSIVFLSSAGIHQMYNFNRVRENWLRHVLALRSRPDSTAPILLWQGNHCPGANIAKTYSETQGPEVVKKYNAKVKAHIAKQGMDYLEGGMNFIPWFNATQGGKTPLVYYNVGELSSHPYPRPQTPQPNRTTANYQVNMEKAQTFLNILDLTWRDAARRGGLATEKLTSS
ncbi:BZ3500_MvSof-1268-A1-R1_C083g00449 [Microbotryum saponariae]|uniref:BZ3500_MvSof-1268-A1-R1_C083g00449 protein n=1 Tax=Microbotryum saponariae TaxID=289078 RepID=A0A2X0MQU2_9BASI|nr:BZ3500_MvSof-1268-A1-R1_C083g00449 [Microbotryum saponariae]